MDEQFIRERITGLRLRKVVRNLRAFAIYIGPTNTNFSQEEHDRLITELIKSMRSDLHKTKHINDGYPLIAISGKNKHH